MGYLYTILKSFIIFPLIAFFFTTPFVLHQYHKYGSISRIRVLIVYSFILYILTIYFLVIMPLPNRDTVTFNPYMVRLIPFTFISDILNETTLVISHPETYLNLFKEPCFYTVIFNILMLIPFGMYLRYYFKLSLKKVILFSFLLSLFFEITQLTGLYFIYPYPYRVFDVDDLIMNTLGGIIGYFLIGLFFPFLPSREEIDNNAFEEGKVVSGFRRITIFCLDFFLYIFLTLFISLFLKKDYLVFVIFIIYYVIFPYFQGGTLGSKFLGVKLEFKKYKLLALTLRIIFLYFYYFGIVFLFLLGIRYLNILKIPWLCFLVCLMIFDFYFLNFLFLIKNKTIFYDKLFRVKHISIINKF